MAFKDKRLTYVVLQCTGCKEWEGGWELQNFVRQLGKQYQEKGSVSQFCSRCDDNTAYVILGTCEEVAKKRTPAQVFALARKR
jgi:hypothetical protein